MKLHYEKPMIEIEHYELSTSIASQCNDVVSAGPAHELHAPCEDYYEIIGKDFPLARSGPYNVGFYDNCDCYYGAGEGFFTS